MNPSFHICVPTWNSLPYLKLLLRGIDQNSTVGTHNVIVHDNGSTDGTEEFLRENRIEYTRSKTNLGFCGVNAALKRANLLPHVMIMNTDMFPLPGWDMEIFKQCLKFKRQNISEYTISSCLIEPVGANPEYDIRNFGTSHEDFDEKGLMLYFNGNRQQLLSRKDTVQYSHPILMPTALMQQIGYMDESYFPGWSSDHDLAAAAYFNANCRNFVMLGRSRVYHFSSKTFQKLPDEIRYRDGQDIFQRKWNMSVDSFRSLLQVKNAYA